MQLECPVVDIAVALQDDLDAAALAGMQEVADPASSLPLIAT